MWIKLISENKTDFYTGHLKFEVGKITSIPDKWDPAPECGNGIHFAKNIFTILDNTKHNGKGFLVEIEPVGDIVTFDNKDKSKEIITKRIITPDEFLEEIKADDPDNWNRLMRACKLGLEEIKADDPDDWNRLMRACKLGEWDNVFKFLN